MSETNKSGQKLPQSGQSGGQGLDYRAAGLDLDLYNQTLDGMAHWVRRTHTPRVMDGFGGFASLVSLDFNNRLFAKNYKHPVLVSGSDGVGTKLKVAAMMNRHHTVGIDLVAMSVNDCLCAGAEPLFFLDYIAIPRDNPPLVEALVRGVSDGCIEAGCALVGGETAILPEVYKEGDYDLAGFCVAVAERDRMVTGKRVRPGDMLVGLGSTGLHSNGYSLARKIVFERAGLTVDSPVAELGRTVGDALLEPTRIYAKVVSELLNHYPIKRKVVRGIAHITGEGLEGNVPRILPPGTRAKVWKNSWHMPAIFPWLQQLGGVSEEEMFRVFNMGLGMVLVVSRYFAESIVKQVERMGVPAFLVGEVVAGEPGLEFTDRPICPI
jgi:phosphoribosylformylglycinamidine cyclo-ligase